MDSAERPWLAVIGHGRPWSGMAGHGQVWPVVAGPGWACLVWQWPIMAGHGSWPCRGLDQGGLRGEGVKEKTDFA